MRDETKHKQKLIKTITTLIFAIPERKIWNKIITTRSGYDKGIIVFLDAQMCYYREKDRGYSEYIERLISDIKGAKR
jgi:hypothetical protein